MTLDRGQTPHFTRAESNAIVVQSLNSPFFPPQIGAQPVRAKEESRITCMRMLRTPPFFPPKSGEKPYLEVLCRFGLWRDFLNDNIQAAISAFRLIKNMSINPKSVEFHQCHANPHSICFFYHNIKDHERNLCQDLLRIENNDSDLKVHAQHCANELLVRVRLSFQKLLQNHSTYRNNTKKMFGKRVTTRTHCRQEYRARYTIFRFLRFYLFYDNVNVRENVFFQGASWKRHCATPTHWRERRGVET